MITITATQIESAHVDLSDSESCSSVDYATIAQAQREEAQTFHGCNLPVAWAIFLRIEDDITTPVYMCTIHFNAFKLALKSGQIGIDLDVFGDID